MGTPLSLPADDHRRSGWTLWREIYGTFIGVLPLVIVLVAAAMTLIRDNDKHTLQIAYLEQANVEMRAQVALARTETEKARMEVLNRLDRVAGQIETLQIQVARAMK